MNDAKLNAVEAEMKRFAERITAFRKAQRKHEWQNPRESGAVRRASMDLTRALADLRRPER